MAISVKPEAFVVQRKNEAVIYEFPWPEWDAELAKYPRTDTVMVAIQRGAPLAVSRLDDDRAKRVGRALIRSGSAAGQYLVTRTVTTTGTPQERRVKTFTILVE